MDATTPRPFDRHAHCQAIAAGGGLATLTRHGLGHYRAIVKAGRAAYVAKHGQAAWLALMKTRGWAPRTASPAVDLAIGEYLAA